MQETSEAILSVELKVANQTRFLALLGHIAEQIGKELAGAAGDHETLAYHLKFGIHGGRRERNPIWLGEQPRKHHPRRD